MQMGRRGRKRQLAVEDEYWALVLSGVGMVAACRQVGITRKTGYRWRAERGGLPPLRLAETERGSRDPVGIGPARAVPSARRPTPASPWGRPFCPFLSRTTCLD